MKFVILGHDGFVGRYVVDALRRAEPAAEVVGTSFLSLDLADVASVPRLSALFDPSAVVLFLAGIKKQHGDSLEIFRRNMAIAAHVCGALAASPVRRMVFFSSAEVYGESTEDTEMTERTPVGPTSYYGIAKFASEGLLRKATDAAGVSLAILRPPLVYGPGDYSASYGPSGFAQAIVRGQSITLWGDGQERRTFLYVSDLAAVAVALARVDATGVFNVATGRSETFREVVDGLAELAGHPVEVHTRARTRPSVDQGYRNDRLLRLFPEMNFTPLADGLRHVLEAERAACVVRPYGG
jgi:UDP-glucose 4-epimerase